MDRQRGNQSRMPLHLVISEKLREQILSGKYPPGSQLPSEFDMGVQFEVSRTTVRRAIANLINQGLVSAHRGRGVFVKERQKVIFSLSNPLSFFATELARQGVTGTIDPISFEVLQPPPDIAAVLNLTNAEPQAYRQQKIILTNQTPIALDIAYFPLDIGAALSEPLQHGFTYATLDQNGFSLERVEVTLESTHATHQVGGYLDLPIGAPLLIYRYVAYGEGDRPLVCGEILSRGDRASYSAVLTKKDLGSYTN